MTTAAKSTAGKMASVITDNRRLISSLPTNATKFGRLSNPTLYAVVCGGMLIAVAFGISVAIPGSFPVLGSVGAMIGLSGGTLLGRKFNDRRGEDEAEDRRVKLERNREIAQLIREERSQPGLSKAEKDRLDAGLAKVNEELISMGLLSYGGPPKTLDLGQKLLPAPIPRT